MNNKLSPLLCTGLAALLSGCDKTVKYVEAPPVVPLSRITRFPEVGTAGGTLYQVTVDGHDYLVVIGIHKAAICPKTPR